MAKKGMKSEQKRTFIVKWKKKLSWLIYDEKLGIVKKKCFICWKQKTVRGGQQVRVSNLVTGSKNFKKVK